MIVYTIEDKLQQIVDLKDVYFPEVSILGLVLYIYFYTNIDKMEMLTNLGRYGLIFLVLRYVLSAVVEIKEYNEDGKVHSNHQSLGVYLFIIIFGLLYMYTHGVMSLNVTIASILLSSMMMILSGRLWTTDAILTIAISLVLLQWNECLRVIAIPLPSGSGSGI